MILSVIWSRNAIEHVQSIYDYIVDDNPLAATAVQENLKGLVGKLSVTPYLGKPGRVDGTRELIASAHMSYIVVYEVVDDEVHVLAVRHSARRWPESFDE